MLTLALFILLAILQLADIASTHHFLRTGRGREANPLMKWVMDRVGVLPALIATKAIFLAAAWYAHWIAVAVLCVLYALVVINNLRIIKQ